VNCLARICGPREAHATNAEGTRPSDVYPEATRRTDDDDGYRLKRGEPRAELPTPREAPVSKLKWLTTGVVQQARLCEQERSLR
jgi:hypothetical protein